MVRHAHRFFFGLANSIIPVARIMAVELLGPEKSVVGIALLPGKPLVCVHPLA